MASKRARVQIVQNVELSVPREYAQQVSDMLHNLELQDEEDKKFEVDSEEVPMDDKESYEVVRVVAHRIVNNAWQFAIKFKGYRETEWIADDDCDCEELIREYLARKHIRVAYLFCRVSSRNQSRYVNVSLDTQKMRLLSVANRIFANELVRVKVYQISASAYRQIPKALVRIGAVAQENDIIMSYRVDRLSRNIFKFLDFLENLRERGVRVYDDQNGLWYHEQRLLFVQNLLDANKEAELIGKRVKDAIEFRVRRGDEAIGSLPFGFCLQRILEPNATREIDGLRQPITQCMKVIVSDSDARAIDFILRSEGNELVARELNNKRWYKRGRMWTPASVKRIRETYDYDWRVSKRPVPPQNKRQRTN